MNNKTILGLAAIIAVTIIIVAGLYFNAHKSNTLSPATSTEQTAMTEAAVSTTPDFTDAELTPAEAIATASAQGIDEQALKQETPPQQKHTPELLSFEYDDQIDGDALLESMIPYADLPKYEQDRMRQYQNYIFEKTAKDIGRPVKGFSLKARGVLETESATHRLYVYKFNTGEGCEFHQVSLDTDTGDYEVRYKHCS
ncbi:hypothetical protein QTA56_07885 [Acinetobacter sp. VNH17]|uniref:Uncharacterized protein n=1 Tax=Acinetobacter thutiue TaxID=2998078 RepID=A0ABT7WNA3_9GAMM|nr:hypothetical protein [Acinetobacter thutiue]MCY6412052.1 hypothetical protein [Acinetobacter thutiue]MDN0014156.1 hypothetical protein [Acinetobacter thutiue]